MGRTKQPLTVEHAILGFLREQPTHGYEVHRRLSAPEALGAIWPLKQAQFYALVNRLEAEGYLAVHVEQRGSLPPRKLLRLTAAGAAAFSAWLHAAPEPGEEGQRSFLARLYFARRLGPVTAHRLLLRQRHERSSQLHTLRAALQKQSPHSFPWLVGQWQLRQAEAALDWLDTFGLPPAPGVAHQIAVLADSPAAVLAHRFVAYVCSPAGQAVLARFGFLPAGKPPAPSGEPAAEPVSDREKTPAESPPGRLVVYAAATLSAAFEALGEAFCAEHPGASIHFSFGGSHALADRLARGANCDIYAPAHQDAMEAVLAAGRVAAGAVTTLAHNQLAIVTPASYSAPPRSLGDLARPGLRLALGSGATAIGRYTQDMLAAATFDGALADDGPAAVLDNVVFYAETVTGVLDKVARGEVDAGIVFTSDCYRAAGAVRMMELFAPSEHLYSASR